MVGFPERGSVRSSPRLRSIMGVEFRGAFQNDEVMGRRGKASPKLPSDLDLLSASSLDSQSFMMAPSTDEVARNLQALTSKCLHGKNYCRQVLCLYELAKVCVRGIPQEHCLGGKWESGVDFGHCGGSSSDGNHQRVGLQVSGRVLA